MCCVIQAEKYGSASFIGAMFVPSFVKIGRFLQTWRSHQSVPFFADLGRKLR